MKFVTTIVSISLFVLVLLQAALSQPSCDTIYSSLGVFTAGYSQKPSDTFVNNNGILELTPSTSGPLFPTNATDNLIFGNIVQTGDISLQVRVTGLGGPLAAGAGIMIRETVDGQDKMFGIFVPRSKGQVEKFGTFSRASTVSLVTNPSQNNFAFANAETSSPYIRLSRVGSIVTAEFSDDSYTWIAFDQFTLTSSSQPVYWGVWAGMSTRTAFFSDVVFKGTSNCPSLCSPPPTSTGTGVCRSSTFMECGLNQWRTMILGTSVSSRAGLIGQRFLSLDNKLDAPFNPLAEDQFQYTFKSIGGDGIVRARFSSFGGSESRAGIAIWTKLVTAIEIGDMFNCYVPIQGSLSQNYRFNRGLTTLTITNPLSVDFISNSAGFVWLEVSKTGSTYQCKYSLDGNSWISVSVPVTTPLTNPTKFNVGFISNQQVVVSQISYSGFQGLCSSNGDCVTNSVGNLDVCQCNSKYLGAFCDQESIEYHNVNYNPGNILIWENLEGWQTLQNGSLVNATRLPIWGDRVYLDAPGTYTVLMASRVELRFLIIGGDASYPTFMTGSQDPWTLSVNETLQIVSGATLEVNNIAQALNLNVSGILRIKNQLADVKGHVNVYSGGSLIFTPNSGYDTVIFSASINCTGTITVETSVNIRFTSNVFINGGVFSKIGNEGVKFNGDLFIIDSSFSGPGSDLQFEATTSSNIILDSLGNPLATYTWKSLGLDQNLLKNSTFTLKDGKFTCLTLSMKGQVTITPNSWIMVTTDFCTFSGSVTGGGSLSCENIRFQGLYYVGMFTGPRTSYDVRLKYIVCSVSMSIAYESWNFYVDKIEYTGLQTNPHSIDTYDTINWYDCTLVKMNIRIRNGKIFNVAGKIKMISSSIQDTSFESYQIHLSTGSVEMVQKSFIYNGYKGIFHHFGPGRITTDPSSYIRNAGVYIVDSTYNDVVVAQAMVNELKIIVQGSTGNMVRFEQAPSYGNQYSFGVSFSIENTNVTLPNMYISFGNVTLSGTIYTPNLTIAANRGYIRIIDSLTVHGSLTIEQNTMMILNLLDSENGLEKININGTFDFGCILYVKIGLKYTPQVGDKIKFLTYQKNSQKDFLRTTQLAVVLIGVPFTSGEINLDGDLEMIASGGFSEGNNNLGQYTICQYLGDARTVDVKSLQSTYSIKAFSYTVPDTKGWVGFGFDTNRGGLNHSVMIVSSANETFCVLDHSIVQNDTCTFFDFSSALVPSFFRVGNKGYRTINFLLDSSEVRNQTNVFLAEHDTEIWRRDGVFPGHTKVEQFPYFLRYLDLRRNGSGNFDGDRSRLWTEFGSVVDRECTNYIQPQRAEVTHPAGLVIMFFIYLVTGILCILLFRLQPMSSRGISPIITLFCLFAQLAMEIRVWDYPTTWYGSNCLYMAVGYFPLQQIVYIMILFYFWRYFSIINLNQSKNDLYGNTEGITRWMKVKTVFLKILASQWLAMSALIIPYLLVIVIFSIPIWVGAYEPYGCSFDTLGGIKTIHSMLLIVVYILIILSGAIDLLLNWRLVVRCNWIKYIFRSDPYYFRVQIWLFIPFMIYSFGVEVASSIIVQTFADSLRNYRWVMGLNTLSCALLLIIDVWFPLILTIIKNVRRRLNKPKNPKSLDEILKRDETIDIFVEFCKQEFSIENISCWKDIQRYKQKPSESLAKELYTKYFSGASSVMEVNVTTTLTSKALQRIQALDLSETLFDELEKQIMGNLFDTYSRFIFYPPFEKYIAQRQMTKELIDGHTNQ